MLFDYSELKQLKKEELEPGMTVYKIYWVRKSKAMLHNDELMSEGIWATTKIEIGSLSAKKNKMKSTDGKDYDLRYYSDHGHPLDGLKFFRPSAVFDEAFRAYCAYFELRELYTGLMGRLHGIGRSESEVYLASAFNYSNFASLNDFLDKANMMKDDLDEAKKKLVAAEVKLAEVTKSLKC